MSDSEYKINEDKKMDLDNLLTYLNVLINGDLQQYALKRYKKNLLNRSPNEVNEKFNDLDTNNILNFKLQLLKINDEILKDYNILKKNTNFVENKKIIENIQKLLIKKEEENIKELEKTKKKIDILFKIIKVEEEKMKRKKKEEERKKKEEERKKKKKEEKLNFMKYLIKIRDEYKNILIFNNKNRFKTFDKYSNYNYYDLKKIESEIKRLKKQIKLFDIVLQIRKQKKKISI